MSEAPKTFFPFEIFYLTRMYGAYPIMKLYHGSNQVVEEPQIVASVRGLDFGKGFYTTSNYEQAVRFTENVIKRKKEGKRTVSVYEINYAELFKECSVLKFETPSEEWLDFVSLNRTNAYIGKIYDMVIGPVANDSVYNVIDLYIDGTYDKDEAIKRLKVRDLFDQWTFCTEKSIEFLKFCSSELI